MTPGREGPINPANVVTAKKHSVGDVLDIGCGEIDEIGDVTIDADPDVHPDVCVDLNDGIPFPDDSFGTVTALHILEHVEDDRALWAEMCRVASERALAIVPIGVRDDPDHERVYRTLDDLRERFGPDTFTYNTMGPYTDICFYMDV